VSTAQGVWLEWGHSMLHRAYREAGYVRSSSKKSLFDKERKIQPWHGEEKEFVMQTSNDMMLVFARSKVSWIVSTMQGTVRMLWWWAGMSADVFRGWACLDFPEVFLASSPVARLGGFTTIYSIDQRFQVSRPRRSFSADGSVQDKLRTFGHWLSTGTRPF